MSVIQTKSISGITSITTPSGADNLLTIHTSDTTERVRVNNSGDVIVGTGVTLSPDGDVYTTGVTTATTFVGALTGNASGNAGGLTGTPNISCGTIAGSTGTFTGDVDIADKIVHTGDTNTAIRFPSADTITAETGGSERIRIDSSGRLIVGHTATDDRDGYNSALQVSGTGGDDSSVSIGRWSGDASSTSLVLSKSRNGTIGSHTVLQANDILGMVQFQGDDGSGFHVGADIRAKVVSGVGNNDMPTDLIFSTNAGSTGTTERLRIATAGQLGIGGANYGTDGQVLTSTGASSAPAWEDAGGKINKYEVTRLETNGTLTNPASTFTEIPNTEVSFTPTTASSYLVVRCHTSFNIKQGSTSNGGEEFYPRPALAIKEINGSATTLGNETIADLALYSNVEHDPASTTGIQISFACSFVARVDVNGKSWSSGAIKFCLGSTSGWNYPMVLLVNDYSSTVYEITEYSE